MKKTLALLGLLFVLAAAALGQSVTGSITASGTTTSCTAVSTTACVILILPPNTGAVGITVSGTFSATLQFEVSSDNGNNWSTVNATPPNSTTAVTSTTSTGIWQATVSGMVLFRVRASVYASGTANINLQSSSAIAGVSGAGGGAPPAGSPTQLQYNLDGTHLGGITGSTFSSTTGTINTPGLVQSNGRPVSVWLGQQYNAYGDSITAGSTGVPQPSQSYTQLLQQDIGGTYNNYAASGAQAADVARLQVFPNANPSYTHTPISTLMIGTNDVTQYGATASQQILYTNALGASIAWLAVPSSSKVFGQACTKTTGFATNDNTFLAGLGIQSTTQNDVLTCTITTTAASAPIYVWYRTFDSKAGTFTVAVDAGATTTLYGSGGGTAASNTATINTLNATTDTVVLYRTANVAAGSHMLVFTVTSATSANNIVNIQSIGAPSTVQQIGYPVVYVGGVPKQQSDANSTLTAAYDVLANNESLLLNQDGNQVYAVPVRSPITAWGTGASYTGPVLNSTTDMFNALHPNVTGNLHLRDAFEWMIQPPGIVDSAPENIITTNTVLLDNSANTGTTTTMATKYVATQIIIPSTGSYVVGDAQCKFDRTGAITNGTTAFVQLQWRTDNAGQPATTSISVGNPIYMGNLPISLGYVNFGAAATQTLSNSTTYWLVITYSAAPTGGQNIQYDSIAGTNQSATSPDGTTWTTTSLPFNCQLRSASITPATFTSIDTPAFIAISNNGAAISATSNSGTAITAIGTNGAAAAFTSTTSNAVVLHTTITKGLVATDTTTSVAILGGCTTCGGAIQGQATGAAGVGVFAQSTSTGDALSANSTSGNDVTAVNGKLKLGSPCASAGGTCAAATSGSVSIAAAATTVVVATTAVAATDRIFVFENMTKGTALSVTCNTTQGRTYAVTTVTAATSFVITTGVAPVTNPACLDYMIIH